MKESLKKFVPAGMWRLIRKHFILRDHKRVAALCDSYIDAYYSSGKKLFNVSPKKNLAEKKIIWQYWAQGFDGELPEVVRVCLDSVDKYKGDYEVIRLSDETIADYVDLPDYVWAKRGHGFTVTAFSNVLRLALLYTYGGVWLDATVLLTDYLPTKYSQYGFFMFQRDEKEPHKKYWEQSYAYYWGWGPKFKVRVLTSIVFAKAGNLFLGDYLNLLLYVWNNNEQYPFYFTFQILFNQLVERGKSSPDCPIVNDCPPHYLMQLINDKSFYLNVDEIVERCSMHKLTFKELSIERFETLIENHFIG